MTTYSSPQAILAIFAAVVSLVCAVWGAVRVGEAALNDRMFLQVLLKLCNAGNLPRMLKLCQAAGRTVPCAVGVLAVCMRCQQDPPMVEAEAYRGAVEEPGGPARDELRRIYREETAPMLGTLSLTGILWGLASLGVLVAAFLHPPAQPHPGIGWWYAILLAASLLVSLWGIHTFRGVHAGTARLIDGLVGPLVEAWMSGKFREDPGQDPAFSGPEGKPAAAGELLFEVHEPGQPARRVAVPRAAVIKIGRLDRSHLRLSHESVARLHAVLEEQGDHWRVIDLGAKVGTVLNGEPVVKAAVREGDTLLLGEVVVRLLPGGA